MLLRLLTPSAPYAGCVGVSHNPYDGLLDFTPPFSCMPSLLSCRKVAQKVHMENVECLLTSMACSKLFDRPYLLLYQIKCLFSSFFRYIVQNPLFRFVSRSFLFVSFLLRMLYCVNIGSVLSLRMFVVVLMTLLAAPMLILSLFLVLSACVR